MNSAALLLTVFATAGLPSADGAWLVPHIEITQARLRSAGDSWQVKPKKEEYICTAPSDGTKCVTIIQGYVPTFR